MPTGPSGPQVKLLRRVRDGRSIRRVDAARRAAEWRRLPSRLEERLRRSVHVWTTDGSGNWLSQVPCCREPALRWNRSRPTFGQDLNGDGTVGVVTTNVESADATTLAKVVNTYSLYGHGTTTGPQLKFSGAAVTVGQFGAWTPLGAEPGAGGYQVAWKNGSADQYIVWTTDTNGNWLSQGAVLSAASFALQSLETTFSQNFNGDGTLGPITTPIETVGPTTLTKVATPTS